MKKTIFTVLSILLLNTITMSQTPWPNYPFVDLNSLCPEDPRPTHPEYVYLIAGEPVPCHTNAFTCAPYGNGPNGPSTNINENIHLNYNVKYELSTKFNYTNTFNNFATNLKDNRSSSIDYFKDNSCNLFLAVANTKGFIVRGGHDYTACIITVLKQDLSINWEAQLTVKDVNNDVCDIIPQDIYINSQSEILVCGKIIASVGSPIKANDFAAKFDNTGTLLWIDYYLTCVSTPQEDAANVILDDENGHVIIAGQAEFIGSSATEKPYIVVINSSTGALIDKSSVPFSGKYTDAIYIGNDRYVTVGTGNNLASLNSDMDMICSVWQLNSGTTLQLLYNHFIGETGTSSTSTHIDECAWSVVQLGNELFVASERSELFGGQSSTLINKLSISALISGTSPLLGTKHITHNDMLSNPNSSLIPVKLIVPPSNPNKVSDHFSVVLNKYNTLPTFPFFIIPTPPVRKNPYSTNPVKSNAFTVFELDNSLNEITNGTFHWFGGNNLEPMDASATNNYFENIAILSLDNTDDDNYNVFIRSTVDKNMTMCNKNCSTYFAPSCSTGIYSSCILSNNLTHSTNTTTSYNGTSPNPNAYTANTSLVAPTLILDKCSTLCDLNAYYVQEFKVIKNSSLVNNLADFKGIIEEGNTTENTNNNNKVLVVSDILGKIAYNNSISSFEDLNNIVLSLPTGIYIVQLSFNNNVYRYKFLK